MSERMRQPGVGGRSIDLRWRHDSHRGYACFCVDQANILRAGFADINSSAQVRCAKTQIPTWSLLQLRSTTSWGAQAVRIAAESLAEAGTHW